MNWEFKAAAEKLQQEQQKRAKAAEKKANDLRKAKEAAERVRLAHEEEARQQRLRTAELREKEILREAELLWRADGVDFHCVLQPTVAFRQGDKVRLPHSALEALSRLGALDKGPMYLALTRAAPDGGGAAARDAIADGSGEGCGPSLPAVTCAGVLEFTATEGTIEVTDKVARCLGLRVDAPALMGADAVVGMALDVGAEGAVAAPLPPLSVRYVHLPKGEFARLVMEEGEGEEEGGALGLQQLPDQKAFMEGVLRPYATLAVGDVLSLQAPHGAPLVLRVAELRPDSQVSLIDTNMEMDIVYTQPGSGGPGAGMAGADGTDGASAGELALAAREDAAPATVRGSVREGLYCYHRMTVSDEVAQMLATGQSHILVSLQVHGEPPPREGDAATTQAQDSTGSDADLYIKRVALASSSWPTVFDHSWSCHNVVDKVVCISDAPPFAGAGVYMVGVHGYRGQARYVLTAQVRSATGGGQKLGGPGVPQTGAAVAGAAGLAQCSNCQQQVPAASVVLHEAYCRRHNVVCGHPGCGLVMRASDRARHVHCVACGKALRDVDVDKHMAVMHRPLPCACGAMLEMEAMIRHRGEECSLRLVTCRFCGALVRAGGVPEDPRDRLQGLCAHEGECGSRTEECDRCKRKVRLKDMPMHLEAVHGQPANSDRGPVLASAPVAASDTMGPPVEGAVQVCSCPVCGVGFQGPNAMLRLNQHLDSHFTAAAIGADANAAVPIASAGREQVGGPDHPAGMAVTSEVATMDIPHATAAPAGRLPAVDQPAGVQCPICSVHLPSERHVSRHIDECH